MTKLHRFMYDVHKAWKFVKITQYIHSFGAQLFDKFLFLQFEAKKSIPLHQSRCS